MSYPLRRSFKRLGLSYSFDRSSLVAVSDASKILFTNINFRGINGPNALNGIITSKLVPSFTMNTLDAAYQPHHGKSIFLGGEFSGLGGTVYTIRPIVQYKQFFPVNKRRNAIGYNLQGSFISGYNGVVAPPFERAYLGGDNDIRGFDIRTISPIAFLPSTQVVTLRNQDNSFVPKDPRIPVGSDSNGRCVPVSNCWNIPVPFEQLVTPGGDLSLTGNLEYRITIAGPVVIAPFVDIGVNPIVRKSQLKINNGQFNDLLNPVWMSERGCSLPVHGRTADCIFAIPPAGSRDELGSAYVHRDRAASHASGDQRPLPHLLGIQPAAPGPKHQPTSPHHTRHVPLSCTGCT